MATREKRPRRAAAVTREYVEDDGNESPTDSRSKTNKRTGRANKKRDDRSALVEIWMVKNEQGDKPSADLKDRYAELLKVPKEKFWDTMKMYALKSKLNCVPDFEQIWHHMKDRADLLADLRVQGVDYWWELDADGSHYKPNTQNLKNFKPASGLLHHFYEVFINDDAYYNDVRHNKAALRRPRIDPEELDELIVKLSPFRSQPEPKALLVMSENRHMRGTYALCKKVNGFHVFVRSARQVSKGRGPVRTVGINGVSVDVPEDKIENYAAQENGLTIFCKEDKKADDEGSETFLHVPFRLRAPNQLLEATIDDLGADVYNLEDNAGVTVYPIRGLLPEHPEIAGSIDFGAVWNGCFSPFPRTAASLQEFSAHFHENFPPECLKYFFTPGSSNDILAEEYIRFMTWFANFSDGLGPNTCNARALYNGLQADNLPFYLQSQSDELRSRQQPGLFSLRLSDTKPECLTIEVLKEEGEGPWAVLCFRVRVRFAPTASGGGGKGGKGGKKAAQNVDGLPQVEFTLEAADGSIAVTTKNRLGLPIMKRIEALAGLPPGVRLQPLLKEGGGGAAIVYGHAQRTLTGNHKRKRTPLDDALPPPMAKMGTAGASAFNDETFDINGEKQLAAGRVRRAASNVLPEGAAAAGGGGGGGGGMGSSQNGGGGAGLSAGAGASSSAPPLAMWGHHIPMPTVGRDHSLAPLPVDKEGTSVNRTESMGIGKGDSWGSVLRNVGLSPTGLNRDHSLLGFNASLGMGGTGGLGGIGRDLSIGSLGELPFSRGASQESVGGMMDVGGGGGASPGELDGDVKREV